MQNFDFYLLAVAVTALALGVFIVWQLRGMIRAAVAYFTPRQHRLNGNIYQIQKRVSTGLEIGLAILLTLLFFWGGQKGLNSLELVESDTTFSTPTTIIPAPEPIPEPYAAPITIDTLPQRSIPLPEAQPPSMPSTEQFYLQVYAFTDRLKAKAQHTYWSENTHHTIWLGIDSGDAVPYKVLIGPFPSMAAARAYRTTHGLSGFPRSGNQLQLLNQ